MGEHKGNTRVVTSTSFINKRLSLNILSKIDNCGINTLRGSSISKVDKMRFADRTSKQYPHEFNAVLQVAQAKLDDRLTYAGS